MCTIKGEFYCANEYNATTEYQHFPAELYLEKKEIGKTGKEYTPSAPEITTLAKKSKPTKKDKGNLVDKVFNSLKSVAASSAVAATAVLGAVTISSTPSVQLTDFSVGGTYVEYEMSIEDLQDNLEYSILISTSNETDRTFLVEDEGVYKNKVEGLQPEWEYTLSVVTYDEYLGKTTFFEKTFQTTALLPKPEPEPAPEPLPDPIPDIPQYQAQISNVTLTGLNEIRIDFATDKLDETCNLTLQLDYGEDGGQSSISVDPRKLMQGYVTTTLPNTVKTLSLTPIIQYGENAQALTFTPFTCDLTEQFTADVMVNTQNNLVTLYLKGMTGGGTYVNVIDTQTSEVVLKEELYEEFNSIEFSYVEGAPILYTVYLTNEADEKTTNDFILEADSAVQETGTYVFNYKNPSNVGITYNEDGTINVYIQTDFTTEDENLYYQVRLDDMWFTSREATFEAKGLVNKNYSLIYDICYDYNGIRYSIMNYTVSGTVNELDIQSIISASYLDESTVELYISDWKAHAVDFNSIRLVSSAGEIITLSETDFTYNEEYGEYTVQVKFTQPFDTVELYGTCGPYVEYMDGIENYAGELYFEMHMPIE